MDIGTGIAVAGIWLFAGMMATSRNVTSSGRWIGIGIAIVVTLLLTAVS